ncbi:hypothetical protein OC844_003688 [Tilletia horrida]|nr:hypothetical protein OC844_003688 [Tilletia horrida]
MSLAMASTVAATAPAAAASTSRIDQHELDLQPGKRPSYATREPSQASTISSADTETYMSPSLGIPVSTSSSTLSSDTHAAAIAAGALMPLSHASYPENVDTLGLEEVDDADATIANQAYPPRSQKQRSFSSSSSSTGTLSPSATILPPSSLSRRNGTGDSTSPDEDEHRTSPALGTGSGQVARGGRLNSYPPVSEEDNEAREVEKNLERWAAEERQRRKALRASRTSSLLAPPAASALARRLSSLRRSPSTNPQGRPIGIGGLEGGAGGSPGEQVPLEELAEEEGSVGSSAANRRSAYGSHRISSQGGSAGLLRKLNGPNGGRESVSSVDSYTSADALTRSGSNTNLHRAGAAAALAGGLSSVHDPDIVAPTSPDATPTGKQVGFFEIDGTPNGITMRSPDRGLLDLEHVSEGDPASNGTPRASQRTAADGRSAAMGSKLKGKARALDYEGQGGSEGSTGRNPFADQADERFNEEGDVSGVSMTLDEGLASPPRGGDARGPSRTPQVRVTSDDDDESAAGTKSAYRHASHYQSSSLSRSSSSYASTTLPAYAKPKPSALRPIVTVGREAPATLERQRREARLSQQYGGKRTGGGTGSEGSLPPSIVATDADAEREADLAEAAAAEMGDANAGAGSGTSSRSRSGSGSGSYSMQSGGKSYGRSGPKSHRALGKRRSHRTIAEGDEPEDDDDPEAEGSDLSPSGPSGLKQPKRRSTHDSRFNEVGLDDDEDDEEYDYDDEEDRDQEWSAARRRRAAADAVAAAAQRERAEEEERNRAERKMWWTEWLCGCGRHAMDEDEQQYGKTNPMG